MDNIIKYMADLFTLDADTLAIVENGIDSLIHQLGKFCKLIYEDVPQICNNCIFDSNANRSSNIYNSVGPKPFRGGKCPVCRGSGYLPASNTTEEIVQLLVDWQPRPSTIIDVRNTDIRLPAGVVMTKGFAVDMPKIIQCKYIIIDYLNAHYTTQKFVKFGEAFLTGNVVRAKYFACFWQRYGS